MILEEGGHSLHRKESTQIKHPNIKRAGGRLVRLLLMTVHHHCIIATSGLRMTWIACGCFG